MKKILLFLLVFPLMSATLFGQVGAKKYTLFEHYTNASCSPCASQNPVFEAFYQNHLEEARHITFHVSWPGSDPMYSLNPDPVDAMVSYHGVGGVPSMFANGIGIGGPAAVSPDLISVETSPIRIIVSEEVEGDVHTVNVKIETVLEVPEGEYFMRVAAIEKYIQYNSAPGSNGEKNFPDVFRDWIANDIAYTPAPVGESVSFSYEYTPNSAWNLDDLYTMAYIVNSANKEVLNTGTTYDLPVELIENSEENLVAASDNGNEFNLYISNNSDEIESITLTLETDQPEDWNAHILFNDEEYTGTTTLDANIGGSDLFLVVNPGASAAVARYSILLSINGGERQQVLSYVVVKGITDLVVSAASEEVDIVSPYTNGLAFAENQAYGRLSVPEFSRAYSNEILSDLNNIYLSIGWTFPALTDELVGYLTTILDNGGNLMIAGQDVGWDIMSGSNASHGTELQMDFYTNYLHVAYDDDGSPSTNSFTMVEDDALFGEVGGSNILNVYGGSNLYPDHIHNADDSGSIFLQYNDNGGGAVRANTGTYKIVYFGIGLEHVSNEEVSNQLVKLSHDWFYDLTGTDEFDNFMHSIQLTNTPNPSNYQTIIDLQGIEENGSILVLDIFGKQVYSQTIDKGQKSLEINTCDWIEGTYFYHFISKSGRSEAIKMVVIH